MGLGTQSLKQLWDSSPQLPYARVSLKFNQISSVSFAYFAPSFHANFMQNFFKSWVSIIGSKHESFVTL